MCFAKASLEKSAWKQSQESTEYQSNQSIRRVSSTFNSVERKCDEPKYVSIGQTLGFSRTSQTSRNVFYLRCCERFGENFICRDDLPVAEPHSYLLSLDSE